MKKAIFLDKDGTLIHNIHYNADPRLITVTEGAIEGLKKLTAAGYTLFVITNQQGVALGYFTEDDVHKVRERIEEILEEENIPLQGFYYCPHHEEKGCSCRKPKPGMIINAAREHYIDLSKSWMIGDTPTDIEAGNKAGCRTLLFDKGYENEWDLTSSQIPDGVVKTLDEAADSILQFSKNERREDSRHSHFQLQKEV